MQSGSKVVQLLSSMEGESWVQKYQGNDKYFPKSVKRFRQAEDSIQSALTKEEIAEFTGKKKGRKSEMEMEIIEETPRNKKSKPTPPKEPTRKQPRRSVNALPPPVLDYDAVPAKILPLNLDNLASLDDDTESCSTVTFDNQVQQKLTKGRTLTEEEHQEMVKEREEERIQIKMEDMMGGLASRLGTMAVDGAGTFSFFILGFRSFSFSFLPFQVLLEK